MKIKVADIIIIDNEGEEITGSERERKLDELRRTETMLDAWIQGEDNDNPFEVDFEGGYMEAKEIKTMRIALGLSQKELADKLGVDAITVSRWERNEQKPSSLAQKQLARLVNKITNEKATEKLSG